jgi:hypothetical protein
MDLSVIVEMLEFLGHITSYSRQNLRMKKGHLPPKAGFSIEEADRLRWAV